MQISLPRHRNLKLLMVRTLALPLPRSQLDRSPVCRSLVGPRLNRRPQILPLTLGLERGGYDSVKGKSRHTWKATMIMNYGYMSSSPAVIDPRIHAQFQWSLLSPLRPMHQLHSPVPIYPVQSDTD